MNDDEVQLLLDIGLERWMMTMGASDADRSSVCEVLYNPDDHPREWGLTQFAFANAARAN